MCNNTLCCLLIQGKRKKLPHNSIKALTWKDCFASIYTFSTLKTVAQSLDSMKNLILFCLSLFMTCIISLLHHSLANILLRHASQTISRKTLCSFANLSIYYLICEFSVFQFNQSSWQVRDLAFHQNEISSMCWLTEDMTVYRIFELFYLLTICGNLYRLRKQEQVVLS